jgi:ATP-dependent protease Clp ATPase subunit
MYDLPSRTDVVKCMVDQDVVLRHVTPTLVTEDESRRSA